MELLKKQLTITIAFYMLMLFLFPCRDTCNKDDHSSPITIEQAQDHHEEENDICSPFCNCSCCAVSFIVTAVEPYVSTNNFPPVIYSEYSSGFYSGFFNSFWQPPKL